MPKTQTQEKRFGVRVIGAIGKNGSGKDEIPKHLSARCGVPFVATGDIVRSLATAQGLEPTRGNLGAISARWFAKHGPGCFVCAAAERIAANSWPVAGISGIRSAGDVRLLKSLHGSDFILIHIVVSDDRVRFERMKRRAEVRDPADVDHFRELDRREEELFHVSEAAAPADCTLTNDNALVDLRAAVDRLVTERELLNPSETASTHVARIPDSPD